MSWKHPSVENQARYHTAEHILTALVRENNCGTISDSRFYGNKGRCDYLISLDQPLKEWALELEGEANRIVETGLDVEYLTMSRAEAEEESEIRTDHLPPGLETVRVVRINRFDSTPCRGEHVSNTADIGYIRIRTVRFVEKGRARLTYVLEDGTDGQDG